MKLSEEERARLERDLHCIKCDAQNRPGVRKIELENTGRACCDECGNVFRWPPRKGSN